MFSLYYFFNVVLYLVEPFDTLLKLKGSLGNFSSEILAFKNLADHKSHSRLFFLRTNVISCYDFLSLLRI
mgnify:CR=1